MVMSTMPIKYAVPAGSARTRLLTACAARYTGCTVRGWDVWDGLDTHPASQNSGRFGYSFGKTRKVVGRAKSDKELKDARHLEPEVVRHFVCGRRKELIERGSRGASEKENILYQMVVTPFEQTDPRD